ncbi:hypothetical protein COX26_02180 [Candidatus Jorgensenbacteria bacterium CG23_combo_of_CG06-09_8_20_14_all_54_14]|uniref:DUF5667 domain-containing protein n=1 Tax=Candidatus Jorgensenbacteria bacterium CG23_combo_of_CG06-09_8_20_14_all_54_14 TaxID=1974595 RepID=A0A2G9Z9E4_9BACT|nr:MAG: hypothetical protein COX26_02180 [Candidatus Jorgensenbacteria bacterium CG23_combo_of_CG06-09_8_20_14_all_54_14]
MNFETPQSNSGQKIEGEEKHEIDHQIYRLDVLLELAEEAIKNKLTISNELSVELSKDIEAAKAKGINLGQIENLDERLNVLSKLAPRAAIEGSMQHLSENIEAGPENRLGQISWYWDSVEKLQQNENTLDIEERNRLAVQLNELAKKIGIDNEIPPTEVS